MMQQSDINTKASRFDECARLERLLSPEMVQKTHAVRHPAQTKIYAQITEGLRRADPVEELEAIDKYTVTILNGAHKDEDVDAWVFGYAGSLLEAIPWFQVDDIIEVVKYDHPDFEAREWWIMETVTRVEEEGEDNEDGSPTILSSIAWNADENRAMAVFL